MDQINDPRDGPQPVGERDTLVDFLRCQRLTLQMKCEGLDASAMAARSVPPSTLSLLGLVRHLAAVEHSWFANVLAGSDVPRPFRGGPDRDEDFNGAVADPAVVAAAWQLWRDEVSFAERFVADAQDLGQTGRMRDGTDISLRSVMVHMIEEYARHNGHADLLRERIDGLTGE